ncbi:DNA replication licensing factor MCM6 [Giardia muris]|uniref:DNA helicase n=1 Tax=Giardia muris TaxID=5742 RepID=A0A4Z1T1S9_GIAMU|nr:DNA replication licensing factor MCM6 [Giardia muris]|eukprot:TNJ26917.1 DNA replication licensing factor MCM6 [Giardia muris]
MAVTWAIEDKDVGLQNGFVEFLTQYYLPNATVPVYVDRLHKLVGMGGDTLFVNLDHLREYNVGLESRLVADFHTCEPLFVDAIRDTLRKEGLDDYLITATEGGTAYATRPLYASFYNVALMHTLSDLKAEHIGRLISVVGTVTRVSSMQPELISGTFRCLSCGEIIPDVRQCYKYTEPGTCVRCQARSGISGSTFELLIERSVFTDYQRVRVQEGFSEDDMRHTTPVAYDVILHNFFANALKPGDSIELTGCFIVLPDVGVIGVPQTVRSTMVRHVSTGAGLVGAAAGAIRPDDFGGATFQDSLRRGRVDEGVTGVKGVGLRELSYTTVIVASHVFVKTPNVLLGKQTQLIARTIDIRDYNEVPPLFIRPSEENNNDGSDEQPFSSLYSTLSDHDCELLMTMRNDPLLIEKFKRSFAPHVYGHEDIKLGIVLQLLGGMTKRTHGDALSIRSDINILLIGDPSTAKSQLLQYTADFYPKSVYTSGKSSSAAGLTAAVVFDPETGDYTVEAGALIRADGGLCLIDEFEKISIQDQTALHECLEQQSISINKAGISITLKARTPVLAAMNPIGSRYQRTKSLKQNLSISQAILSRFDLAFVLLDEPHRETDRLVAARIVTNHITGNPATLATGASELSSSLPSTTVDVPYDFRTLQLYLNLARTVRPLLTEEAINEIAAQWVRLRQQDMSSAARSYRITVRQLESIIRLSEALAKLCLFQRVTKEHVVEAARLVATTCITVHHDRITFVIDPEDVRRARLGIDGRGGKAKGRSNEGDEDDLTDGDEDGNEDKEDEATGRQRPSRQRSESSVGLQVDLEYEELLRLCQIIRYVATTGNVDPNVSVLSISRVDAEGIVSVHARLPEEVESVDRLLIAQAILRKMALEYHWLADEEGIYVFTHLAPTLGF